MVFVSKSEKPSQPLKAVSISKFAWSFGIFLYGAMPEYEYCMSLYNKR
jgi:hypothetical protein